MNKANSPIITPTHPNYFALLDSHINAVREIVDSVDHKWISDDKHGPHPDYYMTIIIKDSHNTPLSGVTRFGNKDELVAFLETTYRLSLPSFRTTPCVNVMIHSTD
jgi:hypothetical protein